MEHLPLSQFCGACGERLLKGEKVVVLLDSKDRTRFSGKLVAAFEFFRKSGLQIATPGCFLRTCPQSTTHGVRCHHQHRIFGVTLHQSCIEVFLAEPAWGDFRTDGLGNPGEAAPPDALACEKRATLLDELWTVASYRTPWAGVAELRLRETQMEKYGALELDIAARVAPMIGLPGLLRLPAELLLMIWRLSEPSLLWRAITVHLLRLDVEAKRGKPEHNRIKRFSLADVVSWQRDACPLQLVETAQRDTLPPFVKITLDHKGILKIERQAERLPCSIQMSECEPRRVYMLEDVRQRRLGQGDVAASDVAATMARLECGRVRLQPPVPDVFSIWNCTSPPDVESFTFEQLARASAAHHKPSTDTESQWIACDLSKCFGVTVLYSNEEIKGMRFHKDIDDGFDCSESAMSSAVKPGYFRAFLPIGPKDRVTAVWIHDDLAHTLVFRLKLAGDIVIGFLDPHQPTTKLLAHGQRISLAYRVPPYNATVQFLGASSSISEAAEHGNRPSPGGSSTEETPSDPIIEIPPSVASKSFFWSDMGEGHSYNMRLYYSKAPLTNIERIRAYSDPRYGICLGLVLFYKNGAMRAVGQCPLGTDTTEDFEDPTSICYRIAPYKQVPNKSRSKMDINGIFFSAGCREAQPIVHYHNEEDWTCTLLGSGILQFFVSVRKSYYMQCVAY